MSDWSDNAQRAGHEIERLTTEVERLTKDVTHVWRHVSEAEGERDEARAVIERVNALGAQWVRAVDCGSQFVALNAVIADLYAALKADAAMEET